MIKRKILCAIPCYNESYNLPQLFLDIEKEKLSEIVDFLFIDDCSTDQTTALINEKGYPLVKHTKNYGYGKSVQTGFKYAVENHYHDFVIFPGDHQRKAHDLKKLIQCLHQGNFDVVTGSKFHIYSDKYGPINRRLGNILYSRIAQYGWKSPIQDVLSGFKVYRVSAVKPFFFTLPKGYPFDICFSLYAGRFGLKVTEIPVDCRYDEHTSKMRSVLFISFKMLMHLIFHFIFQPIICPTSKKQMQTEISDDTA